MSFFFITPLSKVLSLRFKERQDSFFDHIPRVFVTKAFIAISVSMCITWFNNETKCIPPNHDKVLPVHFIQRACWLKGFYIHPELNKLVGETPYYGIPELLGEDGFKTTGHRDDVMLCRTGEEDERCQPMKKEHFNQYKWMPFYMGFMAFMFYFPYMVFQLSNKDVDGLRKIVRNKQVQVKAKDIVDLFFNKRHQHKNIMRLLGNYLVKVLYICISFTSLLVIDRLTHGRFKSYGIEWAEWSNNLNMKDNNGSTGSTLLNKFLPLFGMCDLVDVRLDLTNRFANKMTVVCEISSHILYQYAFVAIWYLLVLSIISSIMGLIFLILGHVQITLKKSKSNTTVLSFQEHLSIRECEYLEYIDQLNISLYNNVVKLLKEQHLQKSGDKVNVMNFAEDVTQFHVSQQ